MLLDIDPALLERIASDAERGLPHEVCGLLLGHRDDEHVNVWALRQSPNACEGDLRVAYCIPPDWMFHTQRTRGRSPWDIVGAYHSHGDGSVQPSRRDLREAWPELVYLIVAVEPRSRMSTHAAWMVRNGSDEFESVEIRVG